MRILHIIRDPRERLALEAASHQAKEHEVALLLVQDAVLVDPHPSSPPYKEGGIRVYALSDDLEARNISAPKEVVLDDPTNRELKCEQKYEPVDYEGAVKLIFEYDKVIVW